MSKTYQGWIEEIERFSSDIETLDIIKSSISSVESKFSPEEIQNLYKKIELSQRSLSNGHYDEDEETNAYSDERLIEANIFDYNFSNYSSNDLSYEVLNVNNLPFPKFLSEVILPLKFPTIMEDLQNPWLAAAMMLNPIALPDTRSSFKTPIHKPVVALIGPSRSGKSERLNLLKSFFPNDRVCHFNGTSSTSFNILQTIDHRTHIYGQLLPTVAVYDNIYFQGGNGKIAINDALGSHFVTLMLAMTRQDAVYTSNYGGKPTLYETYGATAWLSSVDYPLNLNSQLTELMSRLLCFYSCRDNELNRRADETDYNWLGLIDEYRFWWAKEKVENEFLPILAKVKNLNCEAKQIQLPKEKWNISKALVATAVYLEIFDSLDEALESLKNYWKFVEIQNSSGGGMLYQLISKYLKEKFYPYYDKDRPNVSEKLGRDIVTSQDLSIFIEHFSDGIIRINKREQMEIQEIMLQHGFLLEIDTNDESRKAYYKKRKLTH